jgi:hypothetical protein
MSAWDDVDETCKRILKGHKSTRTVVSCGNLRHGALIAINTIVCVVTK